MPDDSTPESQPDSPFPPPSSPYNTAGQPTPNPYGAADLPPSDPYHPGQAAVPPGSGYVAPNPQPHWPPPPVGSYPPPMAVPQYSPVNGTMILILGILGLTICGICAPIAWVMGNQAMTTLNQYGDPLNQRGVVNGGRICGIIGTVLVALALVFYAIAFAFGLFGAMTHPATR